MKKNKQMFKLRFLKDLLTIDITCIQILYRSLYRILDEYMLIAFIVQ